MMREMDSAPVKCPRCGSPNIEAEMPEADGYSAWQVVTCGDCGLRYREVYDFKFIEDDD